MSGSYVVLASGKLRVTLTSTSTRVKLTWRTAKNKKRTATVKVRKGAAVKTLPKGSTRIVAQAKATKKLRTGVKTPISVYVPPPPVVDTAPGPVSGLAVTDATASSISLRWVLPGDADLAQVIVRRAAGSTAPTSADTGQAVALSGPVAVSVTDTGLAPDSQYSFAVFTRDATGNTSTAVTITGRTSPPPDRNAPPAPGGVTAAGTDKALTVSWLAVAATDLAGYRVYSSTSPDGPWAPVDTTSIPGTSRQITGLDNGTQYWVRVTAVDATGNESVPSLPASGVPAVEPLALSVTRLINPDGPTVVATGGFTVTIPAGTVQNVGIPVTVTPVLIDGMDGLVGVDVHFHGTWAPVEGGVQVEAPLPHPVDDSASPVVFHEAGDGLRVSSGDYVQVVAGGLAVRYRLESLSVSWASLLPCVAPAVIPGAGLVAGVWCADSFKDVVVEVFWKSRAEDRARAAQGFTGQQASCPKTGTATTLGPMPWGVACTKVTLRDGTAEWTWLNEAGYDIKVASAGVVFAPRPRHGPATVTMTVDYGGDWLKQAASESAAQTLGVITPQATVSVRKSLNSGETSLDFEPTGSGTAAWELVDEAISLVGEINTVTEIPADIADLTRKCNAKTSDTDWVSCMYSVVKFTIDKYHLLADKGSALKTRLATAKKVIKYLTVAEWVSVYGTFYLADELGGRGSILRNYTPSSRPDARGQSDWIAREPASGRAVHVLGETVYDITNSGTFNCLAQSRLVWDIGSLTQLDQPTAGDATCNESNRSWDERPGTPPDGGNIGTSIILRNPTGNAWLVNSSGGIQTIPDGGTYKCLAATNPVIWNVPDEKIAAWEPKAGFATCGQQLDQWPLPEVDPVPFSLPRGDITEGDSQITNIFPSSTGWWLVVRRKSGEAHSFFQWVGPDGRVGSSWSSPWFTTNDFSIAVSAPDGRLYLEVSSPDAYYDAIVRVGPNGFDAVAHLPELNRWGGGGPTVGRDGSIYVAYDPIGSRARVVRLDPNTLAETAAVELPDSASFGAQELVATEQGLVAYDYSETFLRIPYESITAGVVDAEWEEVLAYKGVDVIASIGSNGTVAATDYASFCDEAAVSAQNPDGRQWLTTAAALAPDLDPERCSGYNVDVLPNGVAVVAIMGNGSRLVWVGPSGAVVKTVHLGNGSPDVAIDAQGRVVVSSEVWEPCTLEDQEETCPRASLRVFDQDGNEVDAWDYARTYVSHGWMVAPTLGGGSVAVLTFPADCSGLYCIPVQDPAYRFEPAPVTVVDTLTGFS